MKTISDELFAYAVQIRRQLHRFPEVGFDLPRTVELVKNELDKMEIAYTERYGTCSVVAELGADEGAPVLALRADMDALPVQEKTGLPFSSQVDGAMHACGHDSHTAVLLTVAKILKQRESELSCRVRLLFQPSEEGAVSGAKMMVDNGAADGVDAVIASHCDNAIPSGKIGVFSGDYMAACIPITIKFHGKTSHAAMPHLGVDAVAMGVEAYGKLRQMVAEEAQPKATPYVWCNGYFSGGEVHNVIPDLCTMYISFRTYDMEFANRVTTRADEICRDIAASYGGTAQVQWHMSTAAVHNDEVLQEEFNTTVGKVLELTDMPRKMSSEDFAWFLQKAPGFIFRFGTYNEALGCTAQAHRNDFCIDEEGMKAAILAFVNFTVNYGKRKGE